MSTVLKKPTGHVVSFRAEAGLLKQLEALMASEHRNLADTLRHLVLKGLAASKKAAQ